MLNCSTSIWILQLLLTWAWAQRLWLRNVDAQLVMLVCHARVVLLDTSDREAVLGSEDACVQRILAVLELMEIQTEEFHANLAHARCQDNREPALARWKETEKSFVTASVDTSAKDAINVLQAMKAIL
jgi:hypothetical protein